MRDGRIVEVMEVVGVEGSRVLFERYLPLHDTVLKRCSDISFGATLEALMLPSSSKRCTVLAVRAIARSAHTPCTGGARRVPHGDLHACPSAPRERSDQHRWRAAERRRRTENAENAWRTGSETITQPSTRTGCRSPRQCCTRRHLARQPGRQQLCSALAR